MFFCTDIFELRTAEISHIDTRSCEFFFFKTLRTSTLLYSVKITPFELSNKFGIITQDVHAPADKKNNSSFPDKLKAFFFYRCLLSVLV